MLSLGSRVEGRKGIGLGLGFLPSEGAMEENELEEGEAFSGHEDDARIDPDIGLSYIDDKLQDVLGHFQRDFEGVVSAENLGAKFGVYGSFLPAYQRSPSILSQPKSPPRPPNHTVSKSPYNSSVECVQQNPSVSRGTSVFKNNTASVAQPSNSSRKENCISSASAGRCVPYLDSDNKPVNLSDQKSLKVRIKVGPDNTLARGNAAIYSGLGLDTSPSSSPEDSPDASLGLYPEFRDALGESPLSILQAMTCFSVPGGRLLSPLHENMFQLTEIESLLSRKSGILGIGVTLSVRDMKGFSDKKIKSDEKNSRSIEEVNLNCKGDMAKTLKKEMDIDTPASKRVVSSVLNLPLQSCSKVADPKAERQTIVDLAKGSSRVLGASKELNKPSGMDRLSLPDSAKDDQFIPMGSVKSGGVGNFGNSTTQSKGKLNSKTSLEKYIEERNPSNHKDISSDTQREGKAKNHKNYDISKLNGDEYKCRNDHVPGHAELMKQMPAQKVISHEKDAEKMLQGNGHLHEGKRRQKESHNNGTLSVESIQTQGNLKAPSSLVPKEKKKSSHSRGDHSEKKSKMMKSRKETSKVHSRESHREVMGNVNVEKVENRADLSEPFISTEKLMERSGVMKDVNLQPEPMSNPPVFTSSMSAAPTSDAAGALDAPPAVLIKENWVCCDKCQRWRLLPYGHDPNNLPKKWKCSMQEWLPGLNKCFISEEETTKAFNALYLVPAPETSANLNGLHAVTASSITSADAQHFDRRFDHDMQSLPTTGKKKSGLVGASNIPHNSVSKKNLQSAVKSRSLTDVGDLVEKVGKHSKSKSKGEANQDGPRASKKIKNENSDYLVEDRLSDLDATGKSAPGMDNGLSVKVTGKILQNYSDYSSSKDSKSEQRDNLTASVKKLEKPEHIYSNGDFRDHFSASNVEKSGMLDYAAKKRKVKEWQESQIYQETIMTPQHTFDSRLSSKEAFSEGDIRKQKKAMVSKSERKDSTMSIDGKTDKKGRSTRILLSCSREQRSDGMGEEGRVGRKEQTGYQETALSRQALDGNDPSKRDLRYVQLPTAATSSSSKVSSSRRSKANLQEARGSPVESVSSSPLRTSALVKISIRSNSEAKDDMVNLDPSFIRSPKKSSDGELGNDQSGIRRKELGCSVQLKSLDSHRVADSGVLGSMEGTGHYPEKETNHLSGGNNKDGLFLKRGVQVNQVPAEFEETNIVSDIENILDRVDKYILDGSEKDNIDDGRINLNNHHRSNGTSQCKLEKSSGFKERNRSSNSDANEGKLKVSDSLSDRKELYSTKNGSNFGSETDFNYNDNSIRHDDVRVENCNFQERDEDYLGKKNPSAKWSRFDRRENHSNIGVDENLNAQNRDFNSKLTVGGASSKSNLQENLQLAPSYPSENPVTHFLLNHNDRSDMASGRAVSQPVQHPKDKSEAQNSGHQKVPTPIKGSRSDTYPIDAANGDGIKLAKQSRKPDSQNGVHVNGLRQGILNGHDSSPMRKDGPSVANVVLKEARDLKHTANRLKGEGLDHESIGLYFQAALKFLYGASLLESSSAESAKHGEMNPSMMMYSDTAKLCEYCAHEYERYKEMAAAALAYKCVEVAYMKVAYYKHPAASKDRHELQTSHQTILPGESPSSSASDVDNLNNQGVLDKAASAKAAVSPQIAGNHVIAAHNRPAFMRMLNYTCDLNCAFDATKRSQNAIATASVNMEKDGVDDISSVRKVLDFNFHNVEELLRLVRLSMESISR